MEKYRVYAGIDLDAVRYNMESMHKNINKDTKMVAVVKTNGYGHGAMRISREVEDLSYLWGYAVATVDEAEELIEDGRTKPILVLGITFPDQFETIVDEDIRPAISELEAAKALSEVAVNKEKMCSVHIAVDTGMSRIGFQVTEESADIIAQIAACRTAVLWLRSILLHLCDNFVAVFCGMLVLEEVYNLSYLRSRCITALHSYRLFNANRLIKQVTVSKKLLCTAFIKYNS